jgi:uncharacterized membrane protein YdbT with pleckstrin-like domain
MPVIQLTQDETVLRVVHKHIFSFFGDFFAIGMFILGPIILFILYFIIPHDFLAPYFAGNPTTAILFFVVTWILFAWMFAWWRWTDHFLDVIIITNKRLFEVKQHGFFRREVATFGIDRIQNIKVSQSGIIASALNFGDVFVETAGEADNLDMKMIPNPSALKLFIHELQDFHKEH